MEPFAIFFLIASSFVLVTFWALKTSKNLPPGPPKLPIIGNLHKVKSTTPYRVLKNLARKYGPIMHLQLGQVPTIVISTPRLAREVMNASVTAIADRPTTITSQIFYYKAQDIGWALYGPYWVQMRNICASELLTAKRVQSYGYIQADELTHVVSYFPSLQFLYGISGKKDKWLETHKQLDVILEEILEEHRNRNRTSGSHDHEDLLYVLLRIKETGDLDVPITKDNIKAVVLDMLIAGMGTPSSVIEWAMHELMRNPKIMKKMQTELRVVVKGNTITEIQSMHYLKLVVKETLRLHSPPLLAPRVTRKPCNLNGYNIPANTNILINEWACATDPDCWENNPESFIPERFENSLINYLGSDFQFIPFGAGRRICPGINFGLNMVEHVIANFLYHFDWKLPNGLKPDEVDMTEVYGVSKLPKYPLQIVPVSMSLAN